MTCADDLDVLIGGYNSFYLGDTTVYKTYFPEITSTVGDIVEIHAYRTSEWTSNDINFGIGTSTVPSFKIYPEVHADFRYINIFTGGV